MGHHTSSRLYNVPFTGESLQLSEQQRIDLNEIAQSRSLPAGFVFRAKLILMLAEGTAFEVIKERLQTAAPTISRWKQRFLEDGLDTYYSGQPAAALTVALRAKILAATRKKPKTVPLTGVVANGRHAQGE